MTAVTLIGKLLKGNEGVATSLVEAAATVALGAMLATVALGGGIDAIDDSKIQAAVAEVNVIAQGVVTFYQDNSFLPLFKDGNAVGPSDAYFSNLVSENGTYPTDPPGTWDIPATPITYISTSELFGHEVVGTDDTIEGHLIRNRLAWTSTDGGLTFTGTEFYPERGTVAGDPRRGWSGPYVGMMSKADPWGGKYLINVRKLHVKHFLDIGSAETLPNIAVMVVSAGPDRALETPADQPGKDFVVYGDDVVFRIK